MKAIELKSIGKLELVEKEKPRPKKDEVLVKIKACGICGSDLPRVYQNGTYHFPTVIGHEFAGKVVELGENVDQKLLNQRVAVFPILPCFHCRSCLSGDYAQCDNYRYFGSRNDGGFEEYLAVPVFNLVPLTDNISYEEGAMIEPATVAQHAIQKSGLKLGDNVVVYGAGPIGIMVARWAKLAGANHIALFDIDNDAINFAQKLGFTNTFFNDGQNNLENIQQAFGGELADIVVEATGNTHSFNNCVQSITKFGTVVLLGNPHSDMTLKRATYDQLMRKEGKIISVYNDVYKRYPTDEWSTTRNALNSKELKVHDLITQRVAIDEVTDLFEHIHNKKIFSCKSMMVIKHKG